MVVVVVSTISRGGGNAVVVVVVAVGSRRCGTALMGCMGLNEASVAAGGGRECEGVGVGVADSSMGDEERCDGREFERADDELVITTVGGVVVVVVVDVVVVPFALDDGVFPVNDDRGRLMLAMGV